jgi:hypothetical protein
MQHLFWGPWIQFLVLQAIYTQFLLDFLIKLLKAKHVYFI